MELTVGGMQWDRGRGSKLPPAAREAKGDATLCIPGRSRAAHLLHEPGQQGRDRSLTRGSLGNPEPAEEDPALISNGGAWMLRRALPNQKEEGCCLL